MKVLQIGGFQMLVTDGSAYWRIGTMLEADGYEVRKRECLQSGRDAKVTDEDILWADIIICYSYGMASFKATVHNHEAAWPVGKRYRMVIVVAGVPDAWMLQFYGNIWHLHDFVDYGRCLQVDAIPQSADLKNSPVTNAKWNEPINPSDRWVNIDCNELVADQDVVGRHTHIQNTLEVAALIYGMIGAIPSTCESSALKRAA